ncbi:cytochrome P450 ClCP1 [Lentithecium fluviatile CBS 122367]|uniref:Cytochrome P450 ClCP1 n=1 Tax=Lentithecium fluviatile CBS 122367 TaxID=1168545 RepID=A0A6G1JDL1_9PLEO|nr:cytochrome P450 ClCP1 [Lentithecium fluviatile CBS 122367]
MGLLLNAAASFILYLITKAIYNLTLHPLTKYPGPKSWVVSRIPYLVCMNKGQLPFRIKTLHDEYGPVVRVSADELSINDTRAWKDIFNRRDLLRPPQWGARPPGVEAHNVISAPAPSHARFRKALTPAYSEKSVKEYEPLIRSYFDKLVAQLDAIIAKERKSTVVDMVEWTNFATFDIIGELSWSKSYECLDKGTGHAFIGALLHFQAFLIGASISYYPWLNAFVAGITPKSAFRMLENIFKDGHERLQARMEMERSKHPDLISHIVDYNTKCSPGDQLTDAEIEQNVLAIIVGGSETLTTAFSGAFHYLLADPSKLARVTEEVRSSFTSESEINANAAAKLPYLNAVMDDTLRLCPPIPDMLRRQVPKGAPTNIAGLVIPADTTVSVSCYSMFKSGDHFSSPETFEPERFLSKESRTGNADVSALAHNDLSAFYPFSLGSHNCLGQPLAKLEMRLLLSLFLYRYNVKVPEGETLSKWTDQKIYWTWEKQPLKVEISRA